MGNGRSLEQFRNSLKNARDTFDRLFDNGRVGWKDADGNERSLSGRFGAVHAEWSDRPDSELEAFVLNLAGAPIGSDTPLATLNFVRTEGGLRVFASRRRERDRRLRDEAIRIHGLDCMVCGFNFEAAFGEQGAGFIEVHHVTPLSETGLTQTDPVTDLSVVCSNCHRMIHRRQGTCMTIGALIKLLRR